MQLILIIQLSLTIFNFPYSQFNNSLDELQSMEYQPVKVRGRFLHDQEIVLGPRSIVNKSSQVGKGGLMTQQDKTTGYLIITPFKLADRE